MKYLVYVLFSIIEYSSLFILMLALFRFEIRDYIKEIALASSISAIFTFFLKYYQFQAISTPIQIITVLLIIKFVFKEKVLKSLWITVSGYVVFAVIQTVVLSVVNYYNLFNVTIIDKYATSTHLLQVVTVAVSYLISFFVRKTNDGFSFSFHRKLFSSSKSFFITISLTVLITLSILFYLYSKYETFVYFELITLIALISLIIILLISRHQEKIQSTEK